MQAVFPKELYNEMNVTAGFRLTLPKTAETAYIKLAAATVFRLFVNGRLTGYGPRRAAHSFSNINTYALDLSAEKNVVVVEVASYRVNSYYLVDEPPFFACEIYTDKALLATAADFEVFHLNDRIQKVPRYSFQRPFAESYAACQCRDGFYTGAAAPYPALNSDAVEGNTLLECDLPYPLFREEVLDGQIEHGRITAADCPRTDYDRSVTQISEKLKGFPMDELESFLLKEAGEIDFVREGESHTGCLADGYRLYDSGHNKTAFIGCRISALEESEVYFIFDEILWDEAKSSPDLAKYFPGDALPLSFFRLDCCNIVKYQLAPGDYELLSFEPYTFRYIKIIVRGKAELKTLYRVPYENSDATKIEFNCSDERLNRIFRAAVSTFAQNAVDVLTDCPSRERAGWLCDSYFSGRAELLLTGANKVEYNFLHSINAAPYSPHLPKGMLPMCYPADHNDGVYIPNWAMFFIIELEDYYRRSGDSVFIDSCRHKVVHFIEHMEYKYRNEDGLLEKLESWVFIEWSRAAEFTQDISIPSNMLYYRTLLAAANLYGIKTYSRRAQEIKDALIRLAYNGEFFEDNLVYEDGVAVRKGNTTETCQYYAFHCGIADRQTFPGLYEKMFTVFGPNRDDKTVYPNVFRANAFIGNYLRLDYLRSEKRLKQVLDECIDYFDYMAKRTMTLWEHDSPLASCNHGFASYAANLIIEAVTGYSGFDVRKKTVTLSEPAVALDFHARLPVGEGYYTISRTGDKITAKAPSGYITVKR